MDQRQALLGNNILSLLNLLREHSTRDPQHAFVVCKYSNETYSYKTAADAAESLVHSFVAQGLEPGAKIILLAENAWFFIPLLAACANRQLTLIPLEPGLHPSELEGILKETSPALVIADDPNKIIGLKVPVVGTSDILNQPNSGTQIEVLAPQKKPSPLLFIYTSGTTGASKAVMLTEENLLADAKALQGFYKLTAEDRLLCVLPFFHMNAIMLTGCLPLLAGSTVILSKLFGAAIAQNYWQMAAEEKASIISLTPSVMRSLLDITKEPAAQSGIRFSFCGAAPLAADLWQTFEETFGLPVYQGYGLSETTCWAVATPPDQPRRYMTVGKVLPGCEVVIDADAIDAETDVFPVREGSENTAESTEDAETKEVIGEVLIKGDILMSGYYQRKKLTKSLYTTEGYFRTGDIGFLDKDGFLEIVGRIKEIIIRRGTNILPADIDPFLTLHDDISECKTVGVTDKAVGEAVMTAWVPSASAVKKPSNIILRKHLLGHISASKIPDRLIPVGALPKTSTGKIAIGTLRKMLNGELAEEILTRINTWQDKRCQPAKLEQISSLINSAILNTQPLEFLTYWGCGARDKPIEAERLAMERLRAFMDKASHTTVLTPCLTLLLTDVHCWVNGKPDERVASYFAEITRLANEFGFKTRLLSDVWAAGGQDPKAFLDPGYQHAYSDEQSWSALAEKLRDALVLQANKHAENGNPEAAGRKYLAGCELESAIIEDICSDSIFLTYNGEDADPFIPDLPRMYIYSTKRGTAIKPWFMD